MKSDSTVRIGHPLRFSRRARGIAHGGGIIFVEIRIDWSTAVVTQQCFVIFVSCGHGLATEGDHEDALELHFVFELFIEVQQHVVYDQEAVFGVVDDVR